MGQKKWFRVGDIDLLVPGQVKEIVVEHKTICLTRREDGYGAICNSCPHQGGPLGEGYIDEDGYVRCPWHGWEFDAKTGRGPPEWPDESVCSFDVDVREDGVYVAIEQHDHPATRMDEVVSTLIAWDVQVVFGMVGHSNLGLAEAFHKAESKGLLKFIGVRHEGAAAFAASGYAKLTGKPAACFSIAGPGATNLLTGLWDAKVDRVPILALTGQVDVQVFGPGAFQEVPLLKAFESVAAFSHVILPSSKASELTALACKNAIVKRDVAHLVFPDNVQTLPASGNKIEGPKGRISEPAIRPATDDVITMISLIRESLRPAIIIGNGGRKFADEIMEFAESIKAVVITTFKAKGSVPEKNDNVCGVIGRSGTLVASTMLKKSDLLIAFGVSFSRHSGIDSKKKIIQIDADRMTLGKFHPVTLPIWADIGETLNELRNVDLGEKIDRTYQVRDFKRLWNEKVEERLEGKPIRNPLIFRTLSEFVPENAVISVDVGNNTYAFGMYYVSGKHDLLMSGYLGSIGFAFPAAMGAWTAGRTVVAIAGDGGFGQYAMEFTTAVKYKMDIKLILLNNSELGKISREQRYGEFDVWSTSLINPNFAEFANSCGGLGIRVENAEKLGEAFKRAFATEGPVLVEIISSPELS